MVDVDTFLTTLCVTADDFCHSRPSKKRPGPEASLSRSEVLTLAIFARWSRFTSERDFYRYAHTKLRNAYPPRPLAVQPLGALLYRAHRGFRLASGNPPLGGRQTSLPGPG
jgi:hypothetical protein